MAEFVAISKRGAIMSSAIGKSHAEKRERRETLEKRKQSGRHVRGGAISDITEKVTQSFRVYSGKGDISE